VPHTLAPEFNVNIYHPTAFIHQASLFILGDSSKNPFSNVGILAIHTFPLMLGPVDS